MSDSGPNSDLYVISTSPSEDAQNCTADTEKKEHTDQQDSRDAQPTSTDRGQGSTEQAADIVSAAASAAGAAITAPKTDTSSIPPKTAESEVPPPKGKNKRSRKAAAEPKEAAIPADTEDINLHVEAGWSEDEKYEKEPAAKRVAAEGADGSTPVASSKKASIGPLDNFTVRAVVTRKDVEVIFEQREGAKEQIESETGSSITIVAGKDDPDIVVDRVLVVKGPIDNVSAAYKIITEGMLAIKQSAAKAKSAKQGAATKDAAKREGGDDAEHDGEHDGEDDEEEEEDGDDDSSDEGQYGGQVVGADISIKDPSLLAADNGASGISWSAALSELGLGMGMPTSTSASVNDTASTSVLAVDSHSKDPMAGAAGGGQSNGTTFSPDPLIQQLLQGAADISSTKGDLMGNVPQSAWLANASNSTMMPQWSTSDDNGIGFNLAAGGSSGAVPGKQAGKKTTSAGGAKAPTKIARSGSRNSASTAAAAGDVPSSSKTSKRQITHQDQLQQLLMGEGGLMSKRGHLGKMQRKWAKKKATSASIAKVLSTAAHIDADAMGSGEVNGIDPEMSGLYQDALQEGEVLDVQEESLIADNSEFLFTSEQMRELREQQMQNFQIVTQALLVTCAEVGPHVPRAQHWKKQLDSLVLWHSLGTREASGALMSSEGLEYFAGPSELPKESVTEGHLVRRQLGQLAPNPASFFALPGITAVVPGIYEAIDEIHRATQITAIDLDARVAGDPVDFGCGSGGGAHSADDSGEVHIFDSKMNFTSSCECTPTHCFRSAILLQCVFPSLYIRMRNNGDAGLGKRKLGDTMDLDDLHSAATTTAADDDKTGGVKQEAVEEAGIKARTGSTRAKKSLKKTGSQKQLAAQGASGNSRRGGMAGAGDCGSLQTIMPLITHENLPAYTVIEVRAVVDEMRQQIRAFKRDLHRVPRSRRRIFVQGDDGVPRLEWMQVKIEPLTLPPAMQCLLVPLVQHLHFQESLVPKIIVVRKPKNRIHFLETEDVLLLMGLRLFGLDDVSSMRVHLMPCKTTSQLRNRMNNLRARRADANPVKDFCLRRIAPFTLEEEEVLRLGVVVYGKEFGQMNQSFLVNRPILALSHMWSQIRSAEKSK
ncbi:hypothetical protein GGI07_002365 [Coemansia sp. Benny D115]|nr:hypothetical protein GGI07_002365 [Coemansia sp. Benny D115]